MITLTDLRGGRVPGPSPKSPGLEETLGRKRAGVKAMSGSMMEALRDL
jgi:hypothetical protein